MAKIDEVKEILNTLRAVLGFLSAFLIAVGGAAGTLFRNDEIGTLFWFCAFLMTIFIFVALVVIRKIKQKTKEIGSL